MKRFFKPVEKEGSSKKPALNTETDPSPNPPVSDGPNAAAAGGGGGDAEEERREPLKFLTWNANSLLLRVKNNWPEFSKFIQTLDPDVIAIQEVRVPAAGIKGAAKNPGEFKDDTSSSREEKQVLMRALSSPPFGNYRAWWSLSDTKYGGTALLVKKQCAPLKVSFNLDRTASKHEQDGRVILAEFKSFFLLNTYVPNNGWKEEENSFQRRRKWDKKLLEFVLRINKPLIWCGDLNVSHQDIDVSHPDFFSNAKYDGYSPPNKEDCGQPGFTLAERRRFTSILSQGKLIDAYRFLHKEQDMECGFSWSGNPIGKYRGERMRIDYFIVSEQLKDRITACDMHGHGIELQGFYGSDHCPKNLGVTWDVDLYGELLKIGGGKERMTAYFNKTAWPANVPETEEERKEFVASLHKRKTKLFMVLIEKKLLPLRPGVARLIDEAMAKGVKVAVCITSNEKAVWAFYLKYYLLCKGLWGHVNGSSTTPDKPDDKVFSTWTTNEHESMETVIKSVSNVIHMQVIHYPFAEAI